MAKQSISQARTEMRIGGWDALVASVDELLQRRPQNIQQDAEEAKPLLQEQIDCGICAVPIYRIALGTQPEPPFERWLSPQPASVLPVSQPDQQVQPIELYKVGETYYLRNGYRQVAAARGRSQLFLRAHVIEYLSDGSARSVDVLHMLIAREQAEFFKQLPFPGNHPAHAFTTSSLGTFDTLAAHIAQARGVLGGYNQYDEQGLLAAWYDRVYLPLARLIRRRHLMAHFPAYSEVDLFLWAVNRHGPWDGNQSLAERMRQARRNLGALWIALRGRTAPRGA